jgi:hypothetical protein
MCLQGSSVATVIESLLRGSMRISAPGDCNHALRQSSGALGVQIAPFTVANDPAATAFGLTSITPIDAGAIVFNRSFWYRSSKLASDHQISAR